MLGRMARVGWQVGSVCIGEACMIDNWFSECHNALLSSPHL